LVSLVLCPDSPAKIVKIKKETEFVVVPVIVSRQQTLTLSEEASDN
jgi:hypothetical protein